MKTLSETFHEAAADYLYLLDRRYPQKALIKLIGDRYQLSGTERSMLYRGICSTDQAIQRKSKLAGADQIQSQWVAVDTYNVLLTIGSYLNGNAVFISNDYWLRDASEIHGKVFRTELLERSLNLVFDYLIHSKPEGLKFYIDSPVSHSGKLSVLINKLMAEKNLAGTAETQQSPDYILKTLTDGIIATSDSTIIDKSQLPVLDLPHLVLNFHFEPEFYDLRGMGGGEG